ncbi:MAG: fumarylacetoacetate hydrolase family protein [Proteobacteria bacterium]|nr:fumarylacetoacetate hydrolase family protein [Pseudomonadota bacterium]
MKLYTFIDHGVERIGAEAADGGMVDLAAASGDAAYFSSMQAMIEGGREALAHAYRSGRATQERNPHPGWVKDRGSDPASPQTPWMLDVREARATVSRRRRTPARSWRTGSRGSLQGKAEGTQSRQLPPPGWYETPGYYLMDVDCIVGTDTLVSWPAYSDWIDYELEIVAVIGRGGKDIARENAYEHIFGYTLVNDLSARDAQLKAMATGLGPAKGKDFDGSNVMGPCIVTADEIPDPYALSAHVLVNGERWSSSDGQEAQFRFDQCIAYASQAQTIRPGEMISTGTLPSCSSLELVRTVRRGDVIDFDVQQIGTLRTRIS